MKGMQHITLSHANSTMGVCEMSPEAIGATAKQSFGSRSECESHKTDRHAAREDTMAMKPQLHTFLTIHFSQKERDSQIQRQTYRGLVRLCVCLYFTLQQFYMHIYC